MNKLIIGLLAATVAAGSGVALNPEKKVTPGEWYGHSLTDTYVRFSTPYLLGLCLATSIYPCAYYELPAGFGHVTQTFTREQGKVWEDMGYLMPFDDGVYVGLFLPY